MIIHYTASGKAVSDFKLKEEIDSLEVGKTYEYSTDNMIVAIREAVFDRKIKFNDVKFKFIDKIMGREIFIHVDDDGNIDKSPRGFDDRIENALLKIFRGRDPK